MASRCRSWSCTCTASSRPRSGRQRRSREGLRIGFLQTPGGALPGGLSKDVADLRERGLLAGHVTAGPAHGGEHEAISVAGGIDAAARVLGWDACVAGPGPGILGSASRLGHGGLAALDTAHAALALGMPTLLAPRLSSSDPRATPSRPQPPQPDRARAAPRAGAGSGPGDRDGGLAAAGPGRAGGRVPGGGARGPDRGDEGPARPGGGGGGPCGVRGERPADPDDGP